MLFGQHFDGELPRNLNHVFLRQFGNGFNEKIGMFMFKNQNDGTTLTVKENSGQRTNEDEVELLEKEAQRRNGTVWEIETQKTGEQFEFLKAVRLRKDDRRKWNREMEINRES